MVDAVVVCFVPKQPPPSPPANSPAMALVEMKTPTIAKIKALGMIMSFAD
ncbi:MAG: hypothetical protein HN478_03780 [Rhodospirillaceae bacterium]|nr:hypothetical protein [Rhodospirillaceae bacterium]MBT7761018.1 hypothetical protein [Rhodospirillaceae bacterium]